MKGLMFQGCEKSYARHYIASHKRLFVILMVVLYLMMIPDFLPSQIILAILSMFLENWMYNNDGSILYVCMICIVVLAFLLPLYQFRFMMKRDSCDLYMSLPIKRSRLFYVHYVIGAIVLVLSTSIFVFFSLVLNIHYPMSSFIHFQMLAFMIGIEILGVALYTFYCWLMMKCNGLLDAIMVGLTYTILPLLAVLAIRIFAGRIYDMILLSSTWELANVTDFIWGIGNFISPVWAMRSLVTFMLQGSRMFISGYTISFYVWLSVIYWSLMALVLYRIARTSFVNRKGENSERKTDSFMTYPALIPLIMFMLLLYFGTENIVISLILFVLYLCMCFFAQRKIKFTIGMIVRYVAIFACVAGLTKVLVQTHVFNTVYEIPPVETIAYIDMQIIHTESEIVTDEHESYYNQTLYEQYKLPKAYSDEKSIKTITNGIELLLDYANKEEERYYFEQEYGVQIYYEIKKEGRTMNERVSRYYYIVNEDTTRFASLLKQWELEGIHFDIVDYNQEGYY